MAKYINKRIHVSVYLGIISLGIILIAASLFNNSNHSDLEKNIFSISSNLGTGLFTSGIIVWLLDTLNIGINDNIIVYKRYNLLKAMSVAIQNFINDSANRYFDLNSSLLNNHIEPRYMEVREVFNKVKMFDINTLKKHGNKYDKGNKLLDIIDNVYGKQMNICDFINISNNILIEKDLYIINGIFSEDEIETFMRLHTTATTYIELVNRQEYVESTRYLDVIYDNIYEMIETIPQFGKMSRMVFQDHTIEYTKPVKIDEISDTRMPP